MLSNLENSVVIQIRELAILDVANQLGIVVKNKKSLCYNGHDKNTASLTFSPKKGLFKCFGCGDAGDGITLVQKVLKLDFSDACNWLASSFKISPLTWQTPIKVLRKKGRIPSKHAAPEIENEFIANSDIYEWIISNSKLSSTSKKYLVDKRSFKAEIIHSLNIVDVPNPTVLFNSLRKIWNESELIKCGIAKYDDVGIIKCVWWDHVILFPFKNEHNRVDYLQARRIINTEPKYVNLKGVSSTIFNLIKLSELETGAEVYLCEGIPDAISAIHYNLNAVGILGANGFKEHWTKLFLPYSVCVIPDTDSGGYLFSKNVRESFKKIGKPIKIIELPKNVKDLNELLIRENNGIQ